MGYELLMNVTSLFNRIIIMTLIVAQVAMQSAYCAGDTGKVHACISPQSAFHFAQNKVIPEFFNFVSDFLKDVLDGNRVHSEWHELIGQFFYGNSVEINKETILGDFPDFMDLTPDFSKETILSFSHKFKFRATDQDKSKNQYFIFQDMFYTANYFPELNRGLWQNVAPENKQRLFDLLTHLAQKGYIQNKEPSDADIEKEIKIANFDEMDKASIKDIWQILDEAFNHEAREVFHHSLRMAYFLLLTEKLRLKEIEHSIEKLRLEIDLARLELKARRIDSDTTQSIENRIVTLEKNIEQLKEEKLWLENMPLEEKTKRNNSIILGSIYHDLAKTSLPFAYLVSRPFSLDQNQANRINQHEKMSGESLVRFLNEEGRNWFEKIDIPTVLSVTVQPMTNTQQEVVTYINMINYPVRNTPVPVPDKKHHFMDYLRIVGKLLKAMVISLFQRSLTPLYKVIHEFDRELVDEGYIRQPESVKKKKDLKDLENNEVITWLKKDAWRSKVADVVDSLLDLTRPYRREQFPFLFEIPGLLRTLRLQNFTGPHSMDLDVVIKSREFQHCLVQFLFPLAGHTFSERLDLSITNTMMLPFLKNLYLENRFVDENLHLKNLFTFFSHITSILLKEGEDSTRKYEEILEYTTLRLLENSHERRKPSLKDSILSIVRIKAKESQDEIEDEAPPSSRIITQVNQNWEGIIRFLLEDYTYQSKNFSLRRINLPKYQGRILDERESLYFVLKCLEPFVPAIDYKLLRRLKKRQSDPHQLRFPGMELELAVAA